MIHRCRCAAHRLHICVGGMTGGQLLDLPFKIADYTDVFGEKEMDRLPPPLPYDCLVDTL